MAIEIPCAFCGPRPFTEFRFGGELRPLDAPDADADFDLDQAAVEAICRAVRCPLLLVHGSEDSCQPLARAQRLSELTGAPLVVVEGADHMIPGRHPVIANLLIRDFVRSLEERGA